MASGLALLALSVALSLMTAAAATGDKRYDIAAYRYTDNPSAAAMASRALTIYVDGDFDAAERERIGLALRQWNHVLNGFVRLRPVLLPADASDGAVAQLRRQGAWIVAKVDSRHPAARDAEIEYLHKPAFETHHIGRFDIAMDDTKAVRMM